MANEATLKQEFNERYKEALISWNAFLEEARKDLSFYAGDQWSATEKSYLAQQRRESLVFNKIKRIINLITGYQRRNRLGFKAVPLEGADPQAASQFTALLMFIMQNCQGFHTMSDAFEQALKVGLGLVEVSLSYRDDPVNGDIQIMRVPYNRFLLDPNIMRRDLSDCAFILRREWLSKEEAKELLPSKASFIDELRPTGLDDKFTLAVKAGYRKRLRWDEYWRRDTEKAIILVDRETGEWRYWPKQGKKEALELFLQQYPQIATHEVYKPVVKLSVFLEDQLVYDGPDPLGINDYPFVPIFCEFDPEYDAYGKRITGIIRAIRDPQRELNKRRSKMLDMIDSQLASGWQAEKSAVVNKKDLYQTGQGKVIWLEDGALTAGRIRKIDPPSIPPSLFQLEQTLSGEIMEIAGVNNELMGVPDNENLRIAGFLAKLRQAAGLTSLQKYFDNYRLAKAMLGDKLVKVIQQNYGPDKVAKILGGPPAREFYDRNFGKYKIDVVESLLSDSQRQMYYRELVMLKQMGAPIPWSAILEAAPIEHREKLQQAVAQEEQNLAQQMAEEKQKDAIWLQAQLAKTREEVASEVERRAETKRELSQSQLNTVKALTALAKLDVEKIKAAVQLLKSLEGASARRRRITTR